MAFPPKKTGDHSPHTIVLQRAQEAAREILSADQTFPFGHKPLLSRLEKVIAEKWIKEKRFG